MLHDVGVPHGEHVTVGHDFVVVKVSHVVVGGGSGGHIGGSHGLHVTVGHTVSRVVVAGGSGEHVGVGQVGVGHVGFSVGGHTHMHVKL